ncbi:MAG: proline racemase family protein [Desulfobulbaceae bacterium]|nr:proline racemase family protein [Desulfobulbaceae bacterium]MCB2215766.1 proline racemase family protein [Desulfobulbaceae bacterium]
MKTSHSFSTIDTHTGGQPTRTVLGGIPRIPGQSMAEKMIYMQTHMDWIRTCLMYEPRGHNLMSGVVLTEPCSAEADFGVIFIETGGYLPMCGHDTIGVSTALVESGMAQVKEPKTKIVLDTPAGIIEVSVEVQDHSACWVTFRGVPSFVFAQDALVDVPGFGRVVLDVAYGGNTYAIVKSENFGIEINPESAGQLIHTGRIVRDAVNAQIQFQHPDYPFINSCTHVEFYAPSRTEGVDAQNAVFFSDMGIDRSPCGTGTSAKLATLYAKGQIAVGQEFVHESIINSIFRARVLEETTVGQYPAIIPEVKGNAHIMAMSTFFIDPDDPHKHGFLLR